MQDCCLSAVQSFVASSKKGRILIAGTSDKKKLRRRSEDAAAIAHIYYNETVVSPKAFL